VPEELVRRAEVQAEAAADALLQGGLVEDVLKLEGRHGQFGQGHGLDTSLGSAGVQETGGVELRLDQLGELQDAGGGFAEDIQTRLDLTARPLYH
jgi:hypothetical protein